MYSKTLFVDLDKTLIKIDLFAESLIKLLLRNPFYLFKVILLLIKGKAQLKSFVASKVSINASNLPYDENVIDLIKNYRASKQKVILATGAPKNYAEEISNYLSLFDDVIATSEELNLTGKNKLNRIQEIVGENGFDYIGDCKKDIPIWKVAESSYLVSDKKKELFGIEFKDIYVVKNKLPKYYAIIKQIRLYQWVKNFLILVPVITSLSFRNEELLLISFATVFLFSLIASSVYIINDIVDVDNDRNHHDKKKRPIASGNISIVTSLTILIIFLIVGLSGSFYFNTYVAFSFLGYLILNLIYSSYGKKIPIADVFFLCFFYMIRIFIGSVATGIVLSNWLLGFAFYLFLSLGFLKRFIEVSKYLPVKESLGRDYGQDDTQFLFTFGSLSALGSTTILALFINEQILGSAYARPNFLWFVFMIISFALIRLWHKAWKREISSDPVKFVLLDPVSMFLIITILCIIYFSA